MNERQEQFIEDSMIGDEFASAVSAHDIELESPLVGEAREALLANGQVRPIEVTINQDIRSDVDPGRIARLTRDAIERRDALCREQAEARRPLVNLDQVRMALEEIATHVKPHVGHAPFTSIACAADDALHELEQYEASLGKGLIGELDRVLLGEDGQSLRVPDHVGVLGLRQQALAQAHERGELYLEVLDEGCLRVQVAGMTDNWKVVRVALGNGEVSDVSAERLLRIAEGRITYLFAGEPWMRYPTMPRARRATRTSLKEGRG